MLFNENTPVYFRFLMIFIMLIWDRLIPKFKIL